MHKADLHHDSNRLQQKLEAIYRLRRTTTKVNWDQAGYLDLLSKLGNPHLHLPPVIHVAGTNGKGSVIAFLRSILEADGKCVHAYTSPHLVKVNERIVVGGQEIDDGYLERMIDDVMAMNNGAPLSFFEIMTAIAFKVFADNPADVVLLEVGMGGRLDCTNVVPKPLVSIINRISLDHTEFLGNSLVGIAREKAGIIKAGVPCVVGYQGDDENAADICGVLKSVADDIGASDCFFVDNCNVAHGGNEFHVSINAAQYNLQYPSMTGCHQVYNAALAVAALDIIKDSFPVAMASIAQGVQKAKWTGRLHKIGTERLPHGREVWLDSGHNDSAGEALAVQAKIWESQDSKPLYLVVGMLGTKDFMRFLMPILPFVKAFRVVPIAFDPEASRSFDDFRCAVHNVSPDTVLVSSENVYDAVHEILSEAPGARILIAGSVYLAGEALESLGE